MRYRTIPLHCIPTIIVYSAFIAGCSHCYRSAIKAKSEGPAGVWTNSTGMTLVLIRPGTFIMGSPPDEAGRRRDESRHTVVLTRPFYLGTNVVTQSQWKVVMGSSPSRFTGDDLPVEDVSWDEASEFCRKLSTRENKHYRLPTEAEWEYACRAGTTTLYYCGRSDRDLDGAAWYAE